MTKRDRMHARIEAHGRRLLAIFPNATETDPVRLCKKLRRIEATIQQRNLEQCNVGMDDGRWETIGDRELDRLDTLLMFRASGVPVFLNGDPRGYALKIREEWMREHNADLYRDWGGYGIIAPDLTED